MKIKTPLLTHRHCDLFFIAGRVRGRDRRRGAARVLPAVWLRGNGAPHGEGGGEAVGVDEDGGGVKGEGHRLL